jgi:hypothetical protein
MAPILTICVLLLCSTICPAAERTSRRPAAAAALLNVVKPLAFAITGTVMAVPSTITFTSPDPDVTPVNGNTTATISWSMNGILNTWTLSVNAAASSFTSCPLVPVSAVKVQCSSATPGLLGSANCAGGTLTLSTSPQTIASGTQGLSGTTTVTVMFTFTDAWKYPANSSCSLSLTYTATGI